MRPVTFWTTEKTKEFKRLYKTMTQVELAKRFKVTLRSIKGQATASGATKRIRGWSKKDDTYLLKHWDDQTKEDLAKHFKKTRSAINRRYKFLKEVTA